MSTIEPANELRRSLLYRTHESLGARYTNYQSQSIIADYGSAELEANAALSAGLCDMSMTARWGCKGRGAPDWMIANGWLLPEQANQAKQQPDGATVARLSNEENLLIGDILLSSNRITELETLHSEQSPSDVYSLPRADSHACFALSGHFAADVMSKICAVDLRAHKFELGEVAQTSVARVNAVVIRQDINYTLCFYVLSDLSSSEYLWDCLLDAMAEFDGRPAGLMALHNLLK